MDDKEILSELAKNNSIKRIVTGNSLEPLYKIGDPMIISPYSYQIITPGTIVYVRMSKDKYLNHKVLSINEGKYTISNMKNKIDGIVTIDAILGICTKP